MILSTKVVEQVIDGARTGRFRKDVVLARPGGEDARRAGIPLAMVRKRALGGGDTLGSVLLIHGYGQNRYAWHLPSRSFGNYLAAAGFDVFNLDLRGHGRSRHLGARPPSDLSEYVREDVPAAVAEVERLSGHERTFLVGHSLGGLIGYGAAPSLGQRIGGVVTLGSPYHFTRGSRFLSFVGDTMLALDRKVGFGDAAVPLKNVGKIMRLARVFVESPLFPLPIRGYAPKSMEPRILGQHMSLAMDRGSLTVIRRMFLSAAKARDSGHRLGVLYGFAEQFEAMDTPLLVIAGSRDGLAPPEAVRPAYARSNARDKTYRTFPRGHIDLIMGREAPLTIWPLIRRWLEDRSNSTATVTPTPQSHTNSESTMHTSPPPASASAESPPLHH